MSSDLENQGMQIELTKYEILTLLFNIRTAVGDHPHDRGAFLPDVLLEEKLCALIGQQPQLRREYGVRKYRKAKFVKLQEPEGAILTIGIGENHQTTYASKLLPNGTLLTGSDALAQTQFDLPERPRKRRSKSQR